MTWNITDYLTGYYPTENQKCPIVDVRHFDMAVIRVGDNSWVHYK